MVKYPPANGGDMGLVNTAVSKITIDGEFTYDKVKQIHDGIVENCTYDSAAVGKDKPEAHSIYGIFVHGTAVCEGYAKAFMYMCQKYNTFYIFNITFNSLVVRLTVVIMRAVGFFSLFFRDYHHCHNLEKISVKSWSIFMPHLCLHPYLH